MKGAPSFWNCIERRVGGNLLNLLIDNVPHSLKSLSSTKSFLSVFLYIDTYESNDLIRKTKITWKYAVPSPIHRSFCWEFVQTVLTQTKCIRKIWHLFYLQNNKAIVLSSFVDNPLFLCRARTKRLWVMPTVTSPMGFYRLFTKLAVRLVRTPVHVMEAWPYAIAVLFHMLSVISFIMNALLWNSYLLKLVSKGLWTPSTCNILL